MKSIPGGNRILVLILIFIFISMMLWARLFFLSVIRHDYYLDRVSNKLIDSNIAGRGSIFLTDKDSLPYAVAVDREFSLVYAVPKKIKNPAVTAKKLAPILEIDEDALIEKLSRPNDPYEVLKRKVSDSVVEAVKTLAEEGISIDQETLRYYTSSGLLDHLIGFLGFDKNGSVAGQYGLEEYYNDKLSGGQTGKGNDLILTIDSSIQAEASILIKDAVAKWNGTSGSIIVMDPKNGEILAMALYPGFDANNYSSVKDKSIFINSVTQSVFEPGSIFKPLTVAIGIETGAVTPETQYYNTGSIVISGKTISNSLVDKNLGWQTMTKVLEQSLNTGAVFIERQIPKDIFLKYLNDFLLDQKTNIDLPEVKGNLANLETGRDINYATAAFGQGVAFTPIEFLRAINVIANSGRLLQPHIVKSIISPNGGISKINPGETKQVISPETAAKLISMMIKVVENGSGHQAKVSGYTIAGKTGTAQVPNFDRAGYSDQTIHSFVGFAPAYNPKFIALIKIDKPQGVRFAESTAVPVFHDLAKFIFSYWKIPPDQPLGQ